MTEQSGSPVVNGEKFERDKVCYEQNCEQARSLNRQMNQVPMLAMTLTGGLWFAAGVTERPDDVIRFSILLFAGVCNIVLIFAAIRIRDVIESYFIRIKEFNQGSYATGKSDKSMLPCLGDYGMICMYCGLMLCGGLLSFVGAVVFFWPFGCVVVSTWP